MRTTVTLDRDVERILREIAHRAHTPFKKVLNDTLRAGIELTAPGKLGNLLRIVKVAPAGDSDARRAMRLRLRDLEDAFQVAAALAWNAECVVTRNLTGYKNSPVRAVSPTQFLQRLR